LERPFDFGTSRTRAYQPGKSEHRSRQVKIAQLGHQGPSERWNPQSITWGVRPDPFWDNRKLSGLSAGEYSSPAPTPVYGKNGGLRFRLGLKTDICHKGRFPRLVGHVVERITCADPHLPHPPITGVAPVESELLARLTADLSRERLNSRPASALPIFASVQCFPVRETTRAPFLR